MTELTEDEIIEQLGNLFRRYKEKKNMPFRELQLLSGVSLGSMNDFMGRGNKAIGLRYIIRLWKALDVPISEITKAMTQKIPELELDIRPVKCCANCTNSTKGTSFICTVTGKYTSPDLCCRKYKGE